MKKLLFSLLLAASMLPSWGQGWGGLGTSAFSVIGGASMMPDLEFGWNVPSSSDVSLLDYNKMQLNSQVGLQWSFVDYFNGFVFGFGAQGTYAKPSINATFQHGNKVIEGSYEEIALGVGFFGNMGWQFDNSLTLLAEITANYDWWGSYLRKNTYAGITVRYTLFEHLLLSASASYTLGRDNNSTTVPLSDSPEIYAKVAGSYPIFFRIGIGYCFHNGLFDVLLN